MSSGLLPQQHFNYVEALPLDMWDFHTEPEMNDLLKTWPQCYKTFLMLNSAEHEILNAHKYKSIKKFSIFQAQIGLKHYFSCS